MVDSPHEMKCAHTAQYWQLPASVNLRALQTRPRSKTHPAQRGRARLPLAIDGGALFL